MTDANTHIMFIDADRRPGIEEIVDRMIPWMIIPENRFYCALLEGHDAKPTLRRWIKNPDSELSLHKTRLMVANDRIGGGFTGFAGRQLQRRRETDLVDLVRNAARKRCPKLRPRLRDLMPLFAPVAPNDFYVSKFGVAPEWNHTDLHQPLLDECLRIAEGGGFDRVRIDIDDRNGPLFGLLDDNGFTVRQTGKADEADIRYLNLVREL